MRTVRTLLVLTSLLAIACGDDSGDSSADASVGDVDADPNAPDADPNAPDAQPGGPDATAPDAAPSTACSIQVGAPDILAVLHSSNGTATATMETGSDGSATFDPCAEDSMLSFATSDEVNGWRGVTIARIGPGDHFEVLLDRLNETTTAEIDVPEDGSDISMIQVAATSLCTADSSEGATANIPVYAQCVGDDSSVVPVLGVGKTASDVWIYSYSTEAEAVPGGTTSVDDMSSPWMTGGSVTATATEENESEVDFNVQPMRGGSPYWWLTQTESVEPVSDVATSTLPTPPNGFSTTRRVGAAKRNMKPRGIVRQITGASADFDLSILLGEISAIDVNNDVEGRPVYTVTGAFSGADYAVIRSQWTNTEWTFLVPASGSTTVQFPAVPPSWAAAVPDTAFFNGIHVVDVTGKSFDEILTDGFRINEYWNQCPDLAEGQECWFSTMTLF